jgi:signal transduction histidine kinase
LGLSIVRNIIDNHEGEIWVEPASPVGTRFMMSFPVKT